ncbi:hypothetical protein HMPREF1425_00696 [Helicobacter pylori GAM71Ai]|nr:hypothetical protein HMPREF1425_00696 [Helicobacter pylori GAM71Ai]
MVVSVGILLQTFQQIGVFQVAIFEQIIVAKEQHSCTGARQKPKWLYGVHLGAEIVDCVIKI